MLVYWIILIFPVLIALCQRYQKQNFHEIGGNSWSFSWVLYWLLLTLLVGLRHEVGGDWVSYFDLFDHIKGEPLSQVFSRPDIAYNFLNWIGANYWGGIYFVNTVCAAIFVHGVLVFCRGQPRPWLAVSIAVPFLIIVVGMGYTRQSAAIGLILLSLVEFNRCSFIRTAVLLITASLFHISAISIIPIFIFIVFGKNLFLSLFVISNLVLCGYFYLPEIIKYVYTGYVEAEYNSSGAIVRVIMNAIPACLFLLYKKKYGLKVLQIKLWSLMAYYALGCIVLLIFIPSSTLVDRISLYFIPLQMFVYSRFPEVFQKTLKGTRVYVVMGIICCNATVQFVWLFFGDHATAWIPYKFYPWEML